MITCKGYSLINFCMINVIILLLLSLVFSSLSILGVGLIGFFILLIIAKNSKQKCFNQLTIIFIISVILMLIMYYGYIDKYGTPYYIGGSDDLNFEQFSKYIISQNYSMPYEIAQDQQFIWYSANGFLWILSWIMRFSDLLGGYHTIAYRVLNIYFLQILSLFVMKYFASKYSFSNRQNLSVLYAMALFPNCQYITLHVFRDTLSILFLFLIFYIWDKHLSEQKIMGKNIILVLVITFLLTYILYWMRVANLIITIIIILVSFFLKDQKLKVGNVGAYIFIAAVGIGVLSTFEIFQKVLLTNETYSEYILSGNDGLANYIFSMDLFPFGIILRVMYGLICPLPVSIIQIPKMFYDIDSFFNVLIAIGTILQIYFLPYLFKNIRNIDKITVLFSAFLLVTVITTFTFRHFIMIYPFMLILIFRQFFQVSKNKKIYNFMCISLLIILFASIYFLIK